MTAVANPAWEKFVAQLGSELLVAQVLVRRLPAGFELRHEADRAANAADLRVVAVSDLRSLAQSTTTGAFRPLKSAPNLAKGWHAVPANEAALHDALDQLYPGAVADWFAAGTQSPPVTHYREFTERQTGMYRVTTMLTDAQAGAVIRACCDVGSCLKRRLWTVAGLESDAARAKSLIPCLEPCAVLLEFARKAVRIEQEERTTLTMAPSELESVIAALEAALERPDAAEREADFNAASNPRRLRLVLEKLRERLAAAKPSQ